MTTISAGQMCPNGFPLAQLPLECGAGAVTCFSGFLNPFNPGGGVDDDGFVVAMVDFRDPVANAPGTGQNWCAPMLHNEFPVTADTWSAKNLGQVFGITIDDASSPNIYVTATTGYGSDIASYQNGNTVALPASPFGPGGAGAVYQINGVTGAISVFATLPNSGPGLGNICFDSGVGAFYVTNFEDGRIYRLSAGGACLSTFDHISETIGTCAPEAGDVDGFVPFRERVWAVKTFGDRVYYGVWSEDRGRPISNGQNEVWSVAIDGAGEFVPNTRQLEISVPSFPSLSWSNPVSDISFSAAGRMMLAERNMLADVGAGARIAWASDGHRSRNLEYELVASVWTPSGRDFFIGTSGSGVGTNAAGGLGYDCDDNLWSTGDQVLISGNPIEAVYGLQRTPEPGNTIATIASTGYFIDFDGVSTVQTKNRIGDVVVYNACCTCMTASVEQIDCEFDDTGLTGKYTVTMEVTNNSGVTAGYVLLPNVDTVPNIIPLVPPLPSGTGEVRTVTFQICDQLPGTTFCFDVLLADLAVEECCTIEVCVDLPECDCIQFSDVTVTCDPTTGAIDLSFTMANLTNDVIEHVFIFKPLPPDPNAGITVLPDYFDLTGSPIAPFTTASIGPITITGAVPGSTLCVLVSGHNADLVECCAEELCFTVPECDGEPTGACCLPDGTCIVTTLSDCLIQQGLYLGDGTPCSDCDNLTPVGACCMADGTCVVVSLFECGNLGGLYLGDNTSCTDCGMQTPVGACCMPGAACVQTTAANCMATGGIYVGDNTPCTDCDTVEFDGACCIPGAGCTVVTEAECTAVGGTFLGPGSDCANCPPLPDPCDLNGDGVVDVVDFLLLMADWGPCPGCAADIDGDGVVGVIDFLTLLAQWS
ncbi:MAG: dockerin type I repeat-containing protein [Planctomycetota bacterium]|jgi:hypothetical protein